MIDMVFMYIGICTILHHVRYFGIANPSLSLSHSVSPSLLLSPLLSSFTDSSSVMVSSAYLVLEDYHDLKLIRHRSLSTKSGIKCRRQRVPREAVDKDMLQAQLQILRGGILLDIQAQVPGFQGNM